MTINEGIVIHDIAYKNSELIIDLLINKNDYNMSSLPKVEIVYSLNNSIVGYLLEASSKEIKSKLCVRCTGDKSNKRYSIIIE